MREVDLNDEESKEAVIQDADTRTTPTTPGGDLAETSPSEGSQGTSRIEVTPVAAGLPVMHESLQDETLLRACSIKDILSSFGEVFDNSIGSADTYSLSKPTTRIRWFVSHNWSTARIHKFAVLALTFNFYPAVVATTIAMIVLLILTASGALPLIEADLSDDYSFRIGICAQLVGPVIFLGVLFTWQEFASSFGLLSLKVFLDKTCINQADDELKREGIMSLAAFLGKTDGMLVVYTPSYLQRLWTVFELASLVILYPENELKVVPVFFARFVVFGILAVMLFMLVFQLGRSNLVEIAIGSFEIQVPVLLNTLFGLLFSFVVLSWVRGKEEMRSAMTSFRMSKALCMDEADRSLVQQSVEIFMKKKHIVEASASIDEALLAFEKMIQEDVAQRLLREVGFQGIPYVYVVAIWIPRLGRTVDLVGAHLHDAVDPGYIAFAAFHQLCINFFVIPVLLAIPSVLMYTCTSLSGWRSTIIALGASLALTVASFAAAIGLDRLHRLVEESPWAILGLVALHLAFAGVVWVIHCWLPQKSHRW